MICFTSAIFRTSLVLLSFLILVQNSAGTNSRHEFIPNYLGCEGQKDGTFKLFDSKKTVLCLNERPIEVRNLQNKAKIQLSGKTKYLKLSEPCSKDIDALLALKRNVVADPNSITKNWVITEPNPCLWNGVYCGPEGSVTRLILQNVKFTSLGNWVSKLVCLKNLDHLQINFAGLKGRIPTDLKKLLNLRLLDLSDNQLEGSIPNALFLGKKRLLSVNLANNSLSGPIPVSLGNQPVMFLQLQNNRLSGGIPAKLVEKFCSLVYLDLSYNPLGGKIPASIGKMTELYYLAISNAKLTGDIPKEIENFNYLHILNLQGNSLNGSLPSLSATSASLEELNLGANLLAGELPAWLSELTNVKILNLSKNGFYGPLPAQLSLPSLEKFDVARNNLNGRIPKGLSKFGKSSFEGNQLCGKPLENCS